MTPRKQKIHYYIFLSLCALILASLFLNRITPSQWSSIFIIMLTLNWIVEGDFKRKLQTFLSNKLIWLFSSLYIINIIGLAYTQNMNDGGHEVTVKMPLLLFPLVIGTSTALKKQHLHHLLLFFVSLVFLTSLWTFKDGFVFPLTQSYALTDFDQKLLINRVYYAIYTGISIFATLYLIFQYTNTWLKIILGIISAYLLLFLVILYVKISYAALAITSLTVITLWLIKNKKTKILLAGGLLLLIVGSVGVYQNSAKLQTVLDKLWKKQGFSSKEYSFNIANSINSRVIMWDCGFTIAKSNWALGVGTGDVQDELIGCYKTKNDFLSKNRQFNAHNEYLQTILRHGIIGLILLMGNLLIPFVLAVRSGSYLHLSFILLFALSFLTESILTRQLGVITYALFNSLFAFSPLNKD